MFLNNFLTLSHLFIHGIFKELQVDSRNINKKFHLKKIVGNNPIQPVYFTEDDTEVKSKQVAQYPTS